MKKATYIYDFNQKFSETIKSYSHPHLKKLLREMKQYKDFYTAADSLGFKYGLEFTVGLIEYEDGVFAYTPILRYKHKNGIEYKVKEQKMSSPLDTIEACYAFLAKEWLYAILLNENFINSESIYS